MLFGCVIEDTELFTSPGGGSWADVELQSSSLADFRLSEDERQLITSSQTLWLIPVLRPLEARHFIIQSG